MKDYLVLWVSHAFCTWGQCAGCYLILRPKNTKCQSTLTFIRRGGPLRSTTAELIRVKRHKFPDAHHRPADCRHVRGCAYLARFQTVVPVPPPDMAGTVYVSSSPVRVKGRFCSVPSQLGNVAVSILKVMVLSAA